MIKVSDFIENHIKRIDAEFIVEDILQPFEKPKECKIKKEAFKPKRNLTHSEYLKVQERGYTWNKKWQCFVKDPVLKIRSFDVETHIVHERLRDNSFLTPHQVQQLEGTIMEICAVSIYDGESYTEAYGSNNISDLLENLKTGRYVTFNGSRFDNFAVRSKLIKMGYKYNPEKPGPGEYSNFYMTKNSMLSFKYVTKANESIEFWDLNRIAAGSLASFLKDMGVGTKLHGYNSKNDPEPESIDGVIQGYDYNKLRYERSDFSPYDIEYCREDVYGLYEATIKLADTIKTNTGLDIFDYITGGSMAIDYVKKGYTRRQGERTLLHAFTDNEELPIEFKVGGKTVYNPKYINKHLNNVMHVDATSFYPSIMSQSKLPVGSASVVELEASELIEYVKNDESKYFFAFGDSGQQAYYDQQFSVLVSLNEGRREYPNFMMGTKDNPILLDDLTLRSPHLTITGTYKVYIYSGVVGFFDKEIATIFSGKKSSKAEGKNALSLVYKILLNSIYGKFLQNPADERFLEVEGSVVSLTEENAEVKWHMHTAYGSAITAAARFELTRLMNIYGDRFVYCDTDSLFLLDTNIEEFSQYCTIGDNLGDWMPDKEAGNGYEDFFMIGRKSYVTNKEDIISATLAGITSKAWINKMHALTFEKIKESLENGVDFTNLTSVQTKDGVVLFDKYVRKVVTHLEV